MKEWLWNGIGLSLPDDWEMLQFTRNPAKGRCAFADRYQFRFELDWLRVDAPPDLQHMADDYLAKLKEDGLKNPAKTAHSPWLGATGIDNGQPISRYATFFPAKSFLVEAVFIWDKKENASASFEGRILDGIHVQPDKLDDTQQWTAFGMDWITSPKLDFESCQVSPGFAEAVFSNEKTRSIQTFSRRGMVEHWLKIPMQDWLENTVPKEYTISESTHSVIRGHEVWHVEAKRSRSVLVDWLHGRRIVKSSAWICPVDKRLYFVSAMAHPDSLTKTPSLACCPDMEAAL